MFPIASKSELTIRQIADYWSREIRPSASVRELREEIMKAFWRGELRPTALTRLDALRRLYETGPTDRVGLPPADSGGFPIPPDDQDDFPARILIPVPNDNPQLWTEEDCEPTLTGIAEFWDETR